MTGLVLIIELMRCGRSARKKGGEVLAWPVCLISGEKKEPRGFLSGGAFQSRTGLDEFAIRCITALLTRHNKFLLIGAGNEVRTRDPNHGKVMLYQLSYSRIA